MAGMSVSSLQYQGGRQSAHVGLRHNRLPRADTARPGQPGKPAFAAPALARRLLRGARRERHRRYGPDSKQD